MKGTLIAIGVIVVALSVMVGGFFAVQGIRRFVAPIEGETQVQEFRHSAENRIAKYNEFFSLCESVQTFETRIDTFTLDVDRYSGDTSERVYTNAVSNLNASVIGRESAVNEYNQDALRDYTGSEFRDLDLPHPLKNGYEAGGTHTLCAVN
jgi:hypothetical protein